MGVLTLNHNPRAYLIVALVVLTALAATAIPRLIGRRKPLNRVDLVINSMLAILLSFVIMYH